MPATDVRIRATEEPGEPGLVQVAIEDPATPNRPFARAERAGGGHAAAGAGAPGRAAHQHLPVAPHGPAALRRGLDVPRPAATTGVREAAGTWATSGVDGVIEALPTPGATLDCAAQVYGWWVLVTQPVNTYCLPQAIERIELFAPLPRRPALHQPSVRITDVTPTAP